MYEELPERGVAASPSSSKDRVNFQESDSGPIGACRDDVLPRWSCKACTILNVRPKPCDDCGVDSTTCNGIQTAECSVCNTPHILRDGQYQIDTNPRPNPRPSRMPAPGLAAFLSGLPDLPPGAHIIIERVRANETPAPQSVSGIRLIRRGENSFVELPENVAELLENSGVLPASRAPPPSNSSTHPRGPQNARSSASTVRQIRREPFKAFAGHWTNLDGTDWVGKTAGLTEEQAKAEFQLKFDEHEQLVPNEPRV